MPDEGNFFSPKRDETNLKQNRNKTESGVTHFTLDRENVNNTIGADVRERMGMDQEFFCEIMEMFEGSKYVFSDPCNPINKFILSQSGYYYQI